MTSRKLKRWLACTAIVLACGAAGSVDDWNVIRAEAAESVAAAPVGRVPVYRRLTTDQYKQIVADIFGPAIKLSGGFEPDKRADGLLAVGASRVSVSATGLSQYDTAARTIAEQVLSKQHRDGFVMCEPAAKNRPDEACATKFITDTGLLLFRRPLTTDETKALVAAAGEAATQLKDFYLGLETALGVMLASPQFLFREEVAEPDPSAAGQHRLDAYTKASRLSFLLWNTAPDQQLLAAAKSGEIHTPAGLKKQVDRMMISPRFERAVRGFFSDMLGFDAMPTLTKDAMLYPRFTAEAASDGQEQTLRTIVDHVVAQNGDYRDLFTTRKTFLTPALGRVYGVPLPRTTPNGAPDEWRTHVFPEGDPHVGILTHISFVSLHSHAFRNSATLRGKAIREVFMCQKVPDPPGDVQFTIVQDTSNPVYKTARDRLTAHATEAMCTGCHKITDPMGLALETFDSDGGYRTTENGVPILTAGEANGQKFKDAAELGKVVSQMPTLTNCLVDRVVAYSAGRSPAKEDAAWVKGLRESFKTSGYRIPELMRQIATSDDYYRVSEPH
jgi:hypothetical protein